MGNNGHGIGWLFEDNSLRRFTKPYTLCNNAAEVETHEGSFFIDRGAGPGGTDRLYVHIWSDATYQGSYNPFSDQFHLGWMEQRIRLVDSRLKLIQLDDVDPVERPTMRVGGRPQLLGGFRKRDVHDAFAGIAAGQQELQTEGCFSGPWFSVQWAGQAATNATLRFDIYVSTNGSTFTKLARTHHACPPGPVRKTDPRKREENDQQSAVRD